MDSVYSELISHKTTTKVKQLTIVIYIVSINSNIDTNNTSDT